MASAVQQNTLSDVQQWRDRRHSGSLLHVVTDNTIKGKASTGGVRECLRLGFDPNAQRKDGCIPLHIACFRNGGEDAITLALRNGIAQVLLKSHARTDIVKQVRGPHLRTLMPLTVIFLVLRSFFGCARGFHIQRKYMPRSCSRLAFNPACSCDRSVGTLAKQIQLGFGHQLNFLFAAMARCHNFPKSPYELAMLDSETSSRLLDPANNEVTVNRALLKC